MPSAETLVLGGFIVLGLGIIWLSLWLDRR